MKLVKYILVLIAGVALYSCGDDYLETRPTRFTNESALNDVSTYDPGIYDGVLAGVYVNLSTPGTGGFDSSDDLGHRGIDIFTDMMSSDMVLGGLNYGWYRGVTDYTWIENEASSRNYQPWRFYYRIIRGANAVIDAQGGNDFVPDSDEGKYIIGQAKALRAFGYFYLSQLEQREYNPTEKILPLYTEAILNNTEQVEMSKIFELIESDLTTAVEYLDGYDRAYKFQINKYVAEGLLAYAYAAQGKYDKALPLADDIIKNGGFTPVQDEEITGGFNDVGTSGWMWGIDITADMKMSLYSWYGVMDIYSYSYAWAGDTKDIDESLYNAMDPSDKRRNQFRSDYVPYRKFYNPDLTIGGTSSDYNEMDYLYMRVSEFHLLAAEAAYKIGNEALAKEYLKDFVKLRVADESYVDNLSGQALMDEISFQTRMELWGEGKSYLLMKRNKETRTRGSNHILLAGETIAYNEPRVTFLIPQAERQNNPFID